jgi:hypothetical protein
MKIKTWYSDKILAESVCDTIKETLEDAVIAGTNLRHANLMDANLKNADLKDTNLRYANLMDANLKNADLKDTNLRYANLMDANLKNADLKDTNLRYANLMGTNLRYANFRYANLRNADFRYANLKDANLRNANLKDAIGLNLTIYTKYRNCPPSGEFVGWKKGSEQEIIKLRIPWFSRRVNAIGSRKCRCEMAIVVSIEKDGKPIRKCYSGYDRSCVYEVGKHVSCDVYDPSWHVECSGGIHFFMVRQEAEDY